MMPHSVVTVVRGLSPEGRPGYAARCVEPGCTETTLGGFPSRSAARRALAGHEKAPASAATGDEGSNSQEGNPMNHDHTTPCTHSDALTRFTHIVSDQGTPDELETWTLPSFAGGEHYIDREPGADWLVSPFVPRNAMSGPDFAVWADEIRVFSAAVDVLRASAVSVPSVEEKHG